MAAAASADDGLRAVSFAPTASSRPALTERRDRDRQASPGAADERALLASGKLAALGELAGDIAHEINNPLFGILGLVDLLLKDAEPGTKTHGRLELVRETGLELKEVVRQVVQFAREPFDERRLVSLHDVVAQALELVRHTSAAKGVEILEEFEEGPIRTEASPAQLKLVLISLLTNAKQAMPDGGTITVALASEEEWAVVRVSDTGPGVALHLAERMFEPFFTTKSERGGSGLGLSVSRTIARLHGGTLDLDSSADEGAAFMLKLPRVET
jgi:two-component system, NtrC family, sensor kinase